MNGARRGELRGQAARFFLVSVVGVLLDLAIAWALASRLGLPLWQAGAIGFVVAAAMNYLLHELWTFGGGTRVSAVRGAQYFGVAGLALATRLGAIVVLEALLGTGRALPVLVLAAGISFGVNFLASRWLFTRKQPITPPATRTPPRV